MDMLPMMMMLAGQKGSTRTDKAEKEKVYEVLAQREKQLMEMLEEDKKRKASEMKMAQNQALMNRLSQLEENLLYSEKKPREYKQKKIEFTDLMKAQALYRNQLIDTLIEINKKPKKLLQPTVYLPVPIRDPGLLPPADPEDAIPQYIPPAQQEKSFVPPPENFGDMWKRDPKAMLNSLRKPQQVLNVAQGSQSGSRGNSARSIPQQKGMGSSLPLIKRPAPSPMGPGYPPTQAAPFPYYPYPGYPPYPNMAPPGYPPYGYPGYGGPPLPPINARPQSSSSTKTGSTNRTDQAGLEALGNPTVLRVYTQQKPKQPPADRDRRPNTDSYYRGRKDPQQDPSAYGSVRDDPEDDDRDVQDYRPKYRMKKFALAVLAVVKWNNLFDLKIRREAQLFYAENAEVVQAKLTNFFRKNFADVLQMIWDLDKPLSITKRRKYYVQYDIDEATVSADHWEIINKFLTEFIVTLNDFFVESELEPEIVNFLARIVWKKNVLAEGVYFESMLARLEFDQYKRLS